MVVKACKGCGKVMEMHSREYCTNCYKKLLWKPISKICKRCKRQKPMHAKGLCAGCYNFVFYLNETKRRNYREYHNIDPDLYEKVTSKCVICGFDKIVDLHHLDENKKNTSPDNMVGLCPNHHKMFHDFRYKTEIVQKLKELGYKVPEDVKLDFKE